ncbi:MAG: esterase/lipase family protein [Candidatus Binataceae bacterium]
MFFDLTAASCLDYMEQFSGLLGDPVCYGVGVPHGNGEPVLLIPGFFAGDWAMAPMARWLRRLGYSPYHSGIDLNLGCPREKAERLGWRIAGIARETGMRVTLVGHSLGGVVARSLSATLPAAVSHTIGLGTPVRNEWAVLKGRIRPFVESIAGFWQHLAGTPAHCGTAKCGCDFAATLCAPRGPSGAFSSVYTREDEVIDWRSCVDRDGANHEVGGRHVSLIVNREVYRILARILAERADARPAAPTSVAPF